MDLPDPVSFLAEVSRRRGWRFDCLDPHSGYLCEVSDGENAFLSGAGKLSAYPLNQATAATIASDKAHTARLLARRGVRVPVGEHFFTTPRFQAKRGPGRMADQAAAYAEYLGYPVFIKPNDGSCGAYADIAYDGDDVRRLLAAMAHAHPVALAQELLHGKEYRVFVVDGEPLLAYERRAGNLIGDGASTVAELLAAQNAALVADGMTPTPDDSPYLRRRLAAQELTLASVLPAGALLQVSARRNVSAGGEVGAFTQSFSADFRAVSEKIAGAVGLRVCGFDVVTAHDLHEVDRWTVLEINSNPSLSGVAKAGYREAVLTVWERIAATWFEEAKRFKEARK
jgi:glutathione synthase/RimK-type ligase-like ATP-grasp enzyme